MDETNLSLNTDKTLIAQFTYSPDCIVKIPVSIKEQKGKFFMKTPVKPEPEWDLTLIIRSIDFPKGHKITLTNSIFDNNDKWEAHVIRRAAHSEYCEVYEISEPKHQKIISLRRTSRIFCLTPILVSINNSQELTKGTCIDISEDGLSMGLRFEEAFTGIIGDSRKIKFFPPFNNLPEIRGKIIRFSNQGIDKAISIGLMIDIKMKDQAQQIAQVLSTANFDEKDSFIPALDNFSIKQAGQKAFSRLAQSFGFETSDRIK